MADQAPLLGLLTTVPDLGDLSGGHRGPSLRFALRQSAAARPEVSGGAASAADGDEEDTAASSVDLLARPSPVAVFSGEQRGDSLVGVFLGVTGRVIFRKRPSQSG